MAPDKTVTVVTVWDDAVGHHVIPVTLVACKRETHLYARVDVFSPSRTGMARRGHPNSLRLP